MNAALLPGAVNINQITTVPDFVPVTHVTASEVIGFNGTGAVAVPGGAAAVAVGTGVTSATVQLTNVFTGSDVFFVDSAALALTTVTVNGSVVGGVPLSVLTVDGTATVVTTIDLGLTSATDVFYNANYGASVTTLNATTSTGAVTTSTAPLLAITSVTLGATGNDTLTDSLMVAKTTTGVTYNMGGGTDTFNISLDNTTGHNIAVAINMGAGSDGINILAPAPDPIVNIITAPVTAANFMTGVTTINNFTTGPTADTLNITNTGVAFTQATAVEQTAISLAPSLFAALGLAECKIADNSDPLRGIFASNTNPF
jgi:hypothetical protein